MGGLFMAYKAVIYANKTTEGLSVIDINVLDDATGRFLARPTKSFIDDINTVPFLDYERVKQIVSKQYKIPATNISFAK